MKKRFIYIFSLTAMLLGYTSCNKYLDINTDPDTNQEPSNFSVLPPILAAMPTGLQSDGGLYVAKYIQNWLTHASANANTYDQQGYAWSGGTMAATWTMTYTNFGKNVDYIIENAIKKGEYEYAGVGLALKAWSFQHTTDYNSDIIFTEAFRSDLFSFKYDTQETVYRGVDSICRIALTYFKRAEANTTSSLSRGDIVYNGDATKWKKFTYGILARNWHHLTNKASYNADSVMKYCDSAMASVSDDFCVPFEASVNDNSNYFGTFRDNMGTLRQSNFIVSLLDGTTLAGSNAFVNRDPRISHMLSCSNDTTNGNGGYRGVSPGQGDPYSALNPPSSYLVNGLPPTATAALNNYNNARRKVGIAWGDSTYVNPSAGAFNDLTGKYLFKNKAVHPVMTYAEMQFIKAEAAFRKGGLQTVAYQAYLNGINAHFDFINRSYTAIRSSPTIFNGSAISATARSRYLASNNVKQNATSLTLSDIMLQKYIALWAHGFFETWVDLRRYHYTDLDPATGLQVYRNFSLPTPLFANNLQKPVYRVRPHFTSEYTYNKAEIDRLQIATPTYHTQEMWFSMP